MMAARPHVDVDLSTRHHDVDVRSGHTPGLDEVRVLFFSTLREKLGRAEDLLPLDGPMTAARFLDILTDRHPELKMYGSSLRLAVNLEYADPSTLVQPGDEVAIITPVSGG